MGNYTIVISGEGPHHNPPPNEGEHITDANVVAANLVSFLKGNGHTITSAVFNTETTTDDLDALTTEVKAPDPDDMSAPPTPNAMKLFKFEAKEGDTVLDTLYVQATSEEAARQTFKDRGFDDLPDDLLTVTEVAELSEGEELLNP